MHERAAVASALQAFLAESGGEVAGVEVEIAPDVDEALVRTIWSEAARGTGAEGAVLECVVGADTLRCFACGAEYGGAKLTPCPQCEGVGLVVAAAPKLTVRTWEAAG